MTTAIGRTLGRYRIESVLGRGGMAEVYRARDPGLDRDVAVKVILPDLTADSEFLQRFESEAKLVAGLDHPNILPVFDFGEHRGRPFVVMPYVPGGTLAERLERLRACGRAVALETALDWGLQIASALDAAHEAGVLHRDVKPGNVLVGHQDRLLLADFGISRLYDATARLTRTGTVVGTPLYMAPEVAAGGDAGTASDLYSLAVMVYEMLAGRPPFEGENPLSILNQHATRPAPPLTDHDPRMPAELDDALARGLAKKPEERPPSCTGFVALLRSGVSGTAAAAGDPVSVTAKTLPLPDSGAVSAEPVPATTSAAASSPPARRWAVAALAGAVVAVGGLLLLRTAGPSASPDPPLPETAAEVAARAGPDEHADPLLEPDPGPPAPDPGAPFPSPGDATRSAPRPEPPGPGAGAWKGPRLAEVRSFRRRSREQDFRRVIEEIDRLRPDGVAAGPAAAFKLYAEGALAYVEGRREVAETVLLRLVREPRFLRLWGPSPLTWIAYGAEGEAGLDDRQLAIGYVDPLGELGTILDRSRAGTAASGAGDDLGRSFSRALVHRLDGEPEAVLEHALPVWDRGHGGEVPAEVRSYLALLIADAHHQLGAAEEALRWYRRAVAAGGIHLGQVAVHAAAIAREQRRLPEALAFLRQACEADDRTACQELRRGSPRRRFPRRPGPGAGPPG